LNQRVDVGVLGATGTVGERLVRLLQNHPWFRLAEVGASERSAGSRLGALIGSNEEGSLSPEVADLPVRSLDGRFHAPVLLSALPSDIAKELEPKLAAAGHLVVSNASSHRMGADIPLIVPEINADHLGLLDSQARRWSGGLLTNPNCAVTSFVLPLAALQDAFGLERVVVTTFQSISGAGKPGPSAADLLDNVIPYIPGEEEKISAEPRKILGRLMGDHIADADFVLSATSTRVPVAHGHLVSVSVALRTAATPEQAMEAFRSYRSGVADDDLPTSPEHPLELMAESNRPQPRLDRDRGNGMTVTVGRVRRCEVGHALLNAELCHVRGLTQKAERAPATAGRAAGG
jgi:aspartate-semialdehyde dehydrogenase